MTQDYVVELDGLKVYRYVMPGIESNMYLMMEDEMSLIIDPNVNLDALSLMRENGIQKVLVLLTHGHYDHISGVNWLRENFTTEVVASQPAERTLHDPTRNMAKFWQILLMDLPPERVEAGMKFLDVDFSCHADRTFAGSTQFSWTKHMICMQSAPGHSEDGALIWIDNILFSGDNLVNGAGVICRLPGGNWKKYCEETRPVIENLPDSTWIMPGHGDPGQLFDLRKYLNKFGNV